MSTSVAKRVRRRVLRWASVLDAEEWGARVVSLIGGDGEAVEQEEDECREDGEEVRNLQGVLEDKAHKDYSVGLPVEGPCFVGGCGIGSAIALECGVGLMDERSAEERPGEEPDKMEAPKERAWELVVVHRIASAEEAEEVLVDEVEPEEPVAVHAAGVAQASEDVPRSCDEEEREGCPVNGFQAAPFFVFAA